MSRVLLLGLAVTAVVATTPVAVSALQVQGADEGLVLRRAGALERAGRLEQAAELLSDFLSDAPASPGALFALERVLRPLDRLDEVVPHVESYLAVVPRSSSVRLLHLRMLAETHHTEDLVDAVEAWITAEPTAPEAYLEGAVRLEEHVGREAAIGVLERGAHAVGEDPGVELALGAALARDGDPDGAAAAWDGVVGSDGAGASDVLARLRALDGAGVAAARSLYHRLVTAPTTTSRQRAAVRFALATGDAERALDAASAVTPLLESTARRGFLSDLARTAEEHGAPRVTLWAYRALRAESREGEEARALDVRIASTALAAGDTAAALEAQRRRARALDPGKPERRRVVADLIRLESSEEDPETLATRVEGFRAEFPDAPELDALASEVARTLRSRGHPEVASRMLEGIDGPHSALERAYVLLAEGKTEEGRSALESSLPGLSPSRVTDVLQLTALLEGTAPVTARRVGEIAAVAHAGDPVGAARALSREIAELPPADHSGILAHAARLADLGGDERLAADLRARLVEEHPDTPERPEAALALARFLASRPGGLDEAVATLESLILARPNSPVVPAARRELERLKGRGAGEERRP